MKEANKGRATAAAYKIWADVGAPHPTGIDLKDLAMFRGVFVREGELSGSEGRLLRKGESGIIHIRKGIIPEGRMRFTLAHELGHWELHSEYSQLLCSAADMRDYGRSPLEVEANYFAAELLMPSILFREACGKKEPSMSLIKALTEEFQTTLTASAIRFADVSKHPVVIVYYENGSVKWSYSDPKKKLPFVMARRQLPQFCSATLDPSEVAEGMDNYDDANWFPELNHGYVVCEETLRMSAFGGGLSLLWLT